MGKCISLNGADWQLTGWYKNQWRFTVSMELGTVFPPPLAPLAATVPGAVQADLLRVGRLADPNLGLRSLDGEWVNNREWAFEKRFTVPADWLQDRCELVFEGLDFAGEVILNGIKLGDFEGMFLPHTFEVTAHLNTDEENGNHLQVLFRQTPEIDGMYGYSRLITKLKSRFNYVWDWCPRIVPVGIWKDVYIRTYRHVNIVDFYPVAEVQEDMHTGHVRFALEVDVLVSGRYTVEYTVRDEQGVLVYDKQEKIDLKGGKRTFCHNAEIRQVRLWWPNGSGEPTVYYAMVRLADDRSEVCPSVVRQIGFRTVEFVSNESSPEGALPYTVRINGKRIFMKGVNWVPIQPFYGAVTEEEYGHYLRRFQAMNVNLLRVWGGAIIEKEAFYDLCDRLGLMVWQELLQSSSAIDNCPSDDPAFLNELERVAAHAIKEKRSHPSLMIWCGGNELMWEQGIPVDERHVNIAMLKRLVQKLDPHRQFLPTSASGPSFVASEHHFGNGVHHDVHGPWFYLGEKTHYSFYNRDDALLRSETGTPGTSRLETLIKWADGHELWPPNKQNPYWVHRGAWWIQWEQLGELFGPWTEDRDEMGLYCQASRYVQKESLRYAAEATRRREPVSSGFIVWMGNEPFPNNANTSLIEYDGMPKPAYYALKKTFSALHVSARYERISYYTGDQFACGIYVHNEHEGMKNEDCTATASIYGADGILLQEAVFVCRMNTGVSHAGEIVWEVKRPAHRLFILSVAVVCASGTADNRYVFTVDGIAPFEPLRTLPQAKITLHDNNGEIIINNESPVCAVGLFLKERNPEHFLQFDMNDLLLFPGERWAVKCVNKPLSVEQVTIEGLNVPL